MITLTDYFGPYKTHPDATPERWQAADELLGRVNRLLERADEAGLHIWDNPVTGSEVSGRINGGFRPQDCPEGALHSSHKEGKAVDIYDPANSLDTWITDELLEELGLYREHPEATPHWCHLTTRAPGSGNRTFHP